MKPTPIDRAKLDESLDGDAKIISCSANGTRVTAQWPDGSRASLYWSYGDWHFSGGGGSPGYDHACGYHD